MYIAELMSTYTTNNIKDPYAQLESPPLWVKIAYAFGQMGWSLAAFGATYMLTYFYLPPEPGAAPVFPSYIFQGVVLGFLTVIGLIGAGGRIFDAITDPLIASYSDRSKAKMGRRRFFMALSFLPLALCSWLLFCPPVAAESPLNAYWLAGMLFLFYLFFTLYVTPYTALISELGHTKDDRLLISTLISVTYALGVAVGFLAPLLQSLLETHWQLSATQAFQWVMGSYAVLAALLLATPIILVDENRYCAKVQSDATTLTSVKAVFSNRNFRMFALSDLMYWIALTFIQTGIIYYITILLRLDKEITSIFTPVLLVLSFLAYIPINIWTKKYGKRRLLLWAFMGFICVFGLICLLGYLPVNAYIQAGFLLLFAILPMATFSILPNAIVADIADADGRKTGNFNTGMFYATRAFMMKIGIAIGNMAFASILLLGKSVENDWGVRLSALIAMFFCMAGYLLFKEYEEDLSSE